MTQLVNSTLRRNIWKNFDTFLDSITWTSTTPTIIQSYNDSNNTFPMIIFPSAKINISSKSLDGSIKERVGNLIFEIHSKDPLQLDQTTDDIDRSLTADTPLEAEGMEFLGDNYWDESEPATWFMNEKEKVHMKVITLSFNASNLKAS